MNLWVKRTGQLALVAVALFFFAGCEIDANILGYPNPKSRFKAYYVEIPLESSVLLMDSIRTSNFTYRSEVLNRMLVGTLNDPQLGKTTTTTYTQFFNRTKIVPDSTAVFDSVSVQLAFDYYVYGPTSVTTSQTLSVHELSESLVDITAGAVPYFSRNSLATGAMLGAKTFSIKDSLSNVIIRLDKAYGQKIFDLALRFRDTQSLPKDQQDTTFYSYKNFIAAVKGIAIKSDAGDKVMGINSTSDFSRIILHYHESDADSLTISLPFSGLASFSQISTDRAGTALSGVTEYAKDYLVDEPKRYVQAGTGLVTKLDFSNFLEFADTVPNIVISSAELSIEGVENDMRPASGLSMRVLMDNNRWNKFSPKNDRDVTDHTNYNKRSLTQSGYYVLGIDGVEGVPLDVDSAFFARGDATLTLNYFSDAKKYSTIYTLFLQQLALNEDKTRFRYFALIPAATNSNWPGTKGVDRAVFPKDKIKLKIYYTKPLTPIP